MVWPAASVLFWELQPVSHPGNRVSKAASAQHSTDLGTAGTKPIELRLLLLAPLGSRKNAGTEFCHLCCTLTLLCSMLCSSLGGSNRCAGLANALDRPCTLSCGGELCPGQARLSGSGLGCLNESPGKEPPRRHAKARQPGKVQPRPRPVQVRLVIGLQRWTGPSLRLRADTAQRRNAAQCSDWEGLARCFGLALGKTSHPLASPRSHSQKPCGAAVPA